MKEENIPKNWKSFGGRDGKVLTDNSLKTKKKSIFLWFIKGMSQKLSVKREIFVFAPIFHAFLETDLVIICSNNRTEKKHWEMFWF